MWFSFVRVALQKITAFTSFEVQTPGQFCQFLLNNWLSAKVIEAPGAFAIQVLWL
jgi:hypothetical protein